MRKLAARQLAGCPSYGSPMYQARSTGDMWMLGRTLEIPRTILGKETPKDSPTAMACWSK